MNRSPSKLKLDGFPTRILTLLQKSKTISPIKQIHAHFIATNLISDPFYASQLLAYITSNPSNMPYAELVFSKATTFNTFMYNTMINGYAQTSEPERGLEIFNEMKSLGVFGDSYTYPFVLKTCGMIGRSVEGKAVHGEVLKSGFGLHVFVVNELVGMYCKCGELGCGREVFNGFCNKDVVTWNVMLGAYVKYQKMNEARKLFDEMSERNAISWSIMIDGYGKRSGDIFHARELFDKMPMRDAVCWNSMLRVYTKVGEMTAAQLLFNEIPDKSVVSWSIMIDGYASHGYPKEALLLFRQMLCSGVIPDSISIVGAILACAQLGAIDEGRWIHMYINKNKIQMDTVLQTALVDMYMKCGKLEEACNIFNHMSKRSVVSWNVMINGLGASGLGEEAINCFRKMEMDGVPPDDVIFIGILTACSHAGLVHEGLHFFKLMKDTYKLEPKLEHYGCLVDILGRAGKIDEALDVVENMPMRPNSALLGSLLLACRTHHNLAQAKVVVRKLAEIEADDGGAYILLSNMYASAGKWGDVQRLHCFIHEKLDKETGKSVVEVDGMVEEFQAGEFNNKCKEETNKTVQSLMKIAETLTDYLSLFS
uniref:Chlororespiratory reduction 4 n=1 Tax=Kalanchoe fedtschenkoi TaxID=63787 RepID=A0A7N0TFK3_KALFE